MKNIKLYSLLAFALFFFSTCTKDFEEINSNPNNPASVPAGLLLGDMLKITADNMYSTFVGGDMGECWIGHWAKVQYNDEERYQPRLNVIRELSWKSNYEDVISDARTMQKLGEAEGNNNIQGVALVMQAFMFAHISDLFGNIPYSEAMRAEEGIFSPAYDSQEEVYNGVLATLDSAVELLSTDGGIIAEASDLLYGGDPEAWEKFANSLKFRCLMRISNKRNVSAELNALMNMPMFMSNEEEAKLSYLSAFPNANPIYETVEYETRKEYKLNEELVNRLVDLGDPRLEVYAQPNTDGEYRGKPAGIADVPNDAYNYDNVSPIGTFYVDPELPGVLLSYAELEFLIAEAAHKGWIAADAGSHYAAGVAANMAWNGIEDASAYLAQANVTYDAANGLDKILTQKWIALFGQGQEAWAEWRRTGVPALPIAIDPFGGINSIPSRFTYPTIEASVNAANYENAVDAQGPDALDTKIWWMN